MSSIDIGITGKKIFTNDAHAPKTIDIKIILNENETLAHQFIVYISYYDMSLYATMILFLMMKTEFGCETPDRIYCSTFFFVCSDVIIYVR